MKIKILFVCALMFTTLSFGQDKNSPAAMVVKNLFYGMNSGLESKSQELKSLFAPSFAEANTISSETIEVQVMRADNFMISEVDGSQITAVLWMNGSTTGYVLELNTTQENGYTYIQPLEVNGNYQVVPWHSWNVKTAMDPSTLIPNTEVLSITAPKAAVKQPTITRALSDFVQFTGNVVSENPSENFFTLILRDADTVILVLSMGTISFNISETKRTDNDVKKIYFKITKNGLTPAALDWNELVITEVSNLSAEEKLQYTVGIESACNYVIDIKGDPKLRLLATLDAGSLE